MGTLHLAVNVRFSILGSTRGLVACLVGLLPFFYFLTLAPCDYITYYQSRGLAVGYGPRYPQDKTWAAPSEVA